MLQVLTSVLVKWEVVSDSELLLGSPPGQAPTVVPCPLLGDHWRRGTQGTLSWMDLGQDSIYYLAPLGGCEDPWSLGDRFSLDPLAADPEMFGHPLGLVYIFLWEKDGGHFQVQLLCQVSL